MWDLVWPFISGLLSCRYDHGNAVHCALFPFLIETPNASYPPPPAGGDKRGGGDADEFLIASTQEETP